MPQEVIFPDGFVRLLQIDRSLLDLRLRRRETSLAYGCECPAHIGEYPALHAVAVMASDMLGAGLGHRRAATVIRKYDEAWLKLIQRDERNPGHGTVLPPSKQLFIAVPNGDDDDENPRAAFGTMEEVLAEMAGENVSVVAVSIQRVLHALRTNARLFDVKLPERFTVQPDDPYYAEWRKEIAAYQRLARARMETRAVRAQARLKKSKAPA